MPNVYIQAVLNDDEASPYGPFVAASLIGPRVYVSVNGTRTLFAHLHGDRWGVVTPFDKDGGHKYVRLDFFPKEAA